jgi:hypothetical protein
MAPELSKGILTDSTDSYMVAKAAISLFGEKPTTVDDASDSLKIPRDGVVARVLRSLLEPDVGQRITWDEAIERLSVVAHVDECAAFLEELYSKSFSPSPLHGMLPLVQHFRSPSFFYFLDLDLQFLVLGSEPESSARPRIVFPAPASTPARPDNAFSSTMQTVEIAAFMAHGLLYPDQDVRDCVEAMCSASESGRAGVFCEFVNALAADKEEDYIRKCGRLLLSFFKRQLFQTPDSLDERKLQRLENALNYARRQAFNDVPAGANIKFSRYSCVVGGHAGFKIRRAPWKARAQLHQRGQAALSVQSLWLDEGASFQAKIGLALSGVSPVFTWCAAV